MKTNANNYAFVDSQNLNLGIQKLGWKLSYKKFRVYLKEKYNVRKAYIFIGFVTLNQKLYDSLQEAGFLLKFKPTIPRPTARTHLDESLKQKTQHFAGFFATQKCQGLTLTLLDTKYIP